MQIFNKLTEAKFYSKIFKINQRGDAIGKLEKFFNFK